MPVETTDTIAACGGFAGALSASMAISRGLWSLCNAERGESRGKDVYRRVDRMGLEAAATAASRHAVTAAGVEAVVRRAIDLRLAWVDGRAPGRLAVRRSVLNPVDFVRSVLRDLRPDHDLRFFAMQNIRHHYDLVQSSHAAHLLHTYAAAVNRHLRVHGGETSPRSTTRLDLRHELLPVLADAIGCEFDGASRSAELFLECCRAVNYLQLSDKLGHVELRTNWIDAEYILSRLFGVPTAIKGLDDLFGGGGLMLVEGGDMAARQRIGGRAVLAVGPAGTGKSLLTLQMAVEVARKGGVAWVMPLEQTPEDCLYTLESMGMLGAAPPLKVASTVSAAVDLLEHPDGEHGALILLRTVKENFEDFLRIFEENVRLMQQYPLRLIAVDPVSAMTHGSDDVTTRRSRLLRMFETVKQMGTNIWLVAEENPHSREPLYEHNIADTVIHLDVQNQHGYAQRYVEVTKSRLQRELRGRHAFALGPATGITIYPSSAAVKARVRMRSHRLPDTPTRFGLAGLDELLGSRGLYAGDVVAIQGPSGCSKTPVGMAFLLSPDLDDGDAARQARDVRALFVSAQHTEGAIRHLLNQVHTQLRKDPAVRGGRQPSDVITVMIEAGYVKPGYILQRIEDEFAKARLNNYSIGRVMIDNVTHWELAPYVREDGVFGETLLNLLRSHRVTALLNCGESKRVDSTLHRSIVEGVDCLIQCDPVEFRGRSRVMIRVMKTRDMGHRRDFFELTASPDALDITPASPLVRIGRNGTINPVRIRLFLPQESAAQAAYNSTILESLDGVLSREVDIEPKVPPHLGRALELASASAVDELQVVQLDEHQLPPEQRRGSGEPIPLHMFQPDSLSRPDRADILPRLRTRMMRADGIIALPYYVNVALLASRSTVHRSCLRSWQELADECRRWEQDHPDQLFFDFSGGRLESYNCLFFEILLALGGAPSARPGAGQRLCFLREWVTSDAAGEAMSLMYRLCGRAHRARRATNADGPNAETATRAASQAQVSRQWYSTLNQLLSEMSPDERGSVEVSPLPGGISVAGDWYLGVPAYCVAPEIGLRIMDLMTSREAELDRLKVGLGLPTRESFYALRQSGPVNVSPYFSMHSEELRSVVENAFPRSTFGCYSSMTSTLSSHLQNLLDIPVPSPETLARVVSRQRDSLMRALDFIGEDRCEYCAHAASRARTEGGPRPIAT